MIKKLFITLLLMALSTNVFASQTTVNYELVIPTGDSRNWLETISRDIVSIDKIMGIISEGSLSAVTSVNIGTSGGIVINPTTGNVLISLISADESTAGYIDATQYTKINIISSDIGASDMIRIISSDVNALGGASVTSINESTASPLVISPTTGDVLITMVSADTSTDGYIDATQYVKINIISNDISAYTGPLIIISDDVGTLKSTQTIISSDVGDNKTNIATNTLGIAIISSDTNDWGIGTDQTKIQFTIVSPASLPTHSRGDQMQPVWTNDTGNTFTVTKIRAYSDTDNYAFHIGITSSLTDFSIANQTTMDIVSCDVAGTDIFTDVIESGFDDATVALSQDILFQHFEGTTNSIKVDIYGNF